MIKIWFWLQIWSVHSTSWHKSENSEIFPISWFFPDFFPISPILDFTGISGKKYRGNGMNYGKNGKYFMAISLSYLLAKTEWKNHFPNSSYLIFAKKPVFGPNPPFWWRHHRTDDVISKKIISACSLYDGLQTWKVSLHYPYPVKSYGGGGGHNVPPPPPPDILSPK